MNRDVSIIGASAAGLFTAFQLAQKGVGVRVFEAKKSINHSPRTLIVTSYMQDLIGSQCKGAVINSIRRFELFADGRVAVISLKRPDLVIDRSKLIQSMAEQAEESGATILNGQRFVSCTPNGKNIHFTVSGNGDGERVEKTANVLVGADGALSKVAQSAGWQKPSTVPLVQAVVELPKDMPSDTTRIWFIPEDTPYFYWLIPHSPTHGVLGLIGDQGQDIRGQLEHFLEIKDLEPIEFQNAHVTQYTRWIPNHRQIGEGSVYLVGDAAGHVKVTTVGGLVTGFRGALGVVEAILNGGSSSEFHLLRLELDLHKWLRRVLHQFRQKDYSMLLDLLTPSVKHSLSLLTRDETRKLLLHVFIKQPRLILLGLRALLSR
jgi:flavin-dependent dehydrogenase